MPSRLNGSMVIPRELDGFSFSQVNWDLLWDNAVCNLFTTFDGRSQMCFYLDLPEEGRSFLEKYVQAYGGLVCKHTDDIDAWTIVLKACPSYVNIGRPCFMLSYLKDCMVERTVRDINGYKLNNSAELCRVDLMDVVFHRKVRFSGKLVLDHVYRDSPRKKKKRSNTKLQDTDVQTITTGLQSDWHHEMADFALKAHLTDIEARDKVAVLKKIAKTCTGSSFVARVNLEPIDGPTSERKEQRQRKKKRVQRVRETRNDSNYCSDDSTSSVSISSFYSIGADSLNELPTRGGNSVSQILPQSSTVPLEVTPNGRANPEERLLSPAQLALNSTEQPSARATEQTAARESELPSPNLVVVDVDGAQEILSEFKEFLEKKDVSHVDALVDRFKREKLTGFIEKKRNTPAANKYKNVSSEEMNSFRLRAKSVISKKPTEILPSTLPKTPRRICLSVSRVCAVSFDPGKTIFRGKSIRDAEVFVVCDAPPLKKFKSPSVLI